MIRPALAAALALAVAACDGDPEPPPASEELETGAISIYAEVRSNGELAQINAAAGTESTSVTLTGEDALFFATTEAAAAGDPGRRLTPLEHSYLGQLETDAVDFDLILQRAGGVRVVSPIQIPPAFSITTPPEPASRTEPMTIAWDPTDGPESATIDIDGPCLSSRVVRGLSPDPGSFLLQPPDLFVIAGSGECDLTVTVTRSGAGQALSPELSVQSRAQTQQVRTATFATVP